MLYHSRTEYFLLTLFVSHIESVFQVKVLIRKPVRLRAINFEAIASRPMCANITLDIGL